LSAEVLGYSGLAHFSVSRIQMSSPAKAGLRERRKDQGSAHDCHLLPSGLAESLGPSDFARIPLHSRGEQTSVSRSPAHHSLGSLEIFMTSDSMALANHLSERRSKAYFEVQNLNTLASLRTNAEPAMDQERIWPLLYLWHTVTGIDVG
jgi:hypothetical protein